MLVAGGGVAWLVDSAFINIPNQHQIIKDAKIMAVMEYVNLLFDGSRPDILYTETSCT